MSDFALGLIHGPYSGMFLPGWGEPTEGEQVVVQDGDGPRAVYEVIRDPLTHVHFALYVGAAEDDLASFAQEVEGAGEDDLADDLAIEASSYLATR